MPMSGAVMLMRSFSNMGKLIDVACDRHRWFYAPAVLMSVSPQS